MPKDQSFSAAEREAMQDRAKELKAQKGAGKKEAQLKDMMEKIDAMPKEEKAMALRLHELVMAAGPELEPKTWYGMPAWASGGKTVLFFQAPSKWGSRYATLGFDERANLDDGEMWATSFAITKLTPEVEKKITQLVKRAVSS